MESSTETNYSLNQDSGNDGNQNTSLQSIPINKWSNQHILEWLCKRLPQIYEAHRDSFIENEITGDIFLSTSFNLTCLDQLKIYDRNLREQLMAEISLLKIKNEYEFIKRFKSVPMTTKI